MSYRSWLVTLLAVGFLALTAAVPRPANAQTANSHYVFSHWLTATNNGDLNGAMQYLGADFTVTLADGSQVAGQAEGEQAIMALGTPITVVSLATTTNHELDAQLQFGAGGATMSVVIIGESDAIKSITISAAAAVTPSPASSQAATPLPTLTPTSTGG